MDRRDKFKVIISFIETAQKEDIIDETEQENLLDLAEYLYKR